MIFVYGFVTIANTHFEGGEFSFKYWLTDYVSSFVEYVHPFGGNTVTCFIYSLDFFQLLRLQINSSQCPVHICLIGTCTDVLLLFFISIQRYRWPTRYYVAVNRYLHVFVFNSSTLEYDGDCSWYNYE
jgi:hypothetical protein